MLLGVIFVQNLLHTIPNPHKPFQESLTLRIWYFCQNIPKKSFSVISHLSALARQFLNAFIITIQICFFYILMLPILEESIFLQYLHTCLLFTSYYQFKNTARVSCLYSSFKQELSTLVVVEEEVEDKHFWQGVNIRRTVKSFTVSVMWMTSQLAPLSMVQGCCLRTSVFEG